MPAPQTVQEATAEATLNEIFRSEGDRLRRYLRAGGASHEDADDAANEAFARLWRALRARTIRDPRAFLFTTARNVVSTRYRRSHAGKRGGGTTPCSLDDDRNQLVERLLGDQSFEVRANVDLRELGAIINAALTSLSRRHHDIFSLCVLQEHSHKHAAKELAITVASVTAGLHRARENLRREIQEQLGERK